jgi:ribosome maturation factor RimP
LDEDDNEESDNPAPFFNSDKFMKDKILELTEDTITTFGFILVDVKILPSKNGMTLKAVIYRKGEGVSMDDCARVSNVLLRRLDVEVAHFSENYDLIVESPGADRRITSVRELGIFQDREMIFTLKNPSFFGLKENVIHGRVTRLSGETIEFSSERGTYNMEWNDLAGAKLYFNIKNYL